MPPQRKRRMDEPEAVAGSNSKGRHLTEKKLRIADEAFNNDSLLELFEKTLVSTQSMLNEKGIRAGFSVQKMMNICKDLLSNYPSDLLRVSFSDFFTTLIASAKSAESGLRDDDEINLFLGEFVKFIWWGTTNVDKLPTEALLRLLLSVCEVPDLIEFSADFPRQLPKNAQAIYAKEAGITYEEAVAKWKELTAKERKPSLEKLCKEVCDYQEGMSRFLRMNPHLQPVHKEHIERKQEKAGAAIEKLKKNIRSLEEQCREQNSQDAASFKKFRSIMLKELPSDMSESAKEKLVKEKFASTDPMVLMVMRKMVAGDKSDK